MVGELDDSKILGAFTGFYQDKHHLVPELDAGHNAHVSNGCNMSHRFCCPLGRGRPLDKHLPVLASPVLLRQDNRRRALHARPDVILPGHGLLFFNRRHRHPHPADPCGLETENDLAAEDCCHCRSVLGHFVSLAVLPRHPASARSRLCLLTVNI